MLKIKAPRKPMFKHCTLILPYQDRQNMSVQVVSLCTLVREFTDLNGIIKNLKSPEHGLGINIGKNLNYP